MSTDERHMHDAAAAERAADQERFRKWNELTTGVRSAQAGSTPACPPSIRR